MLDMYRCLKTFQNNVLTNSDNVQKQNSRFIFVATVIYFLSFLSFLLAGYGGDDAGYKMYWDNTYPLYDYIANGKIMDHSDRAIEPFYSYIFAFMKTFVDNFGIFKFFNTLLTLSILAYSYYKISKKYYLIMLILTLLYFYIDTNIDQFRSGLAASIALLSVVFLSENKLKSSLTFFVLAALIHNSMLWLIIIYFARNRHIHLIMVFLLGILIFIPDKALIVEHYLKSLNLINIEYGAHIINKLQSYTFRSIDINYQNEIFALVMFKTIVIYLIGVKYKINRIFLNTYLYSILLFYFFIDFYTIGARIIRSALLLEPIFLYFILKQNKYWILLVLPILLFNIFAKNLGLIERMMR